MQIMVSLTDVLELAILGVFLLIYFLVHGRIWLRQKFCKHAEFFENGQCHAICRGCGKDLGFVGSVRDFRKAQSEKNKQQ